MIGGFKEDARLTEGIETMKEVATTTDEAKQREIEAHHGIEGNTEVVVDEMKRRMKANTNGVDATLKRKRMRMKKKEKNPILDFLEN